MNAPLSPRLIVLRRARAFASLLPPLADVPLLEQGDAEAEAAEDAAFVAAFLRAETGPRRADAGERDG